MADHVAGPVGDEVTAARDFSPAARLTYRVLRAALSLALRIWFRVEVVGGSRIPATGPYILAPGAHRSILDTPLVAITGPRVLRYMGAENFFRIPGVGWFLSAMGGFPVERHATDRVALRRAEEVLADGDPLVVFPEGTRFSGPEVRPLKQGAAFLAGRSRAPIIPVGIGGAERALPRGRYLPRPAKIVLVIGEAMDPPGEPGRRVRRREIMAVSDQLRDRLQSLFDEAQARAGVG
ncbi:MAG: lysophospholipid acyltransferase family protein [Acidimicrobiales bacterium]